MRKKKRSKSKRTLNSNLKFLVVALLVIVAITLVGKNISQKQSSQNKNVLGSLLSKGDDSDDDSSGSSGSESSGSGSSGSGSSGSGSSGGNSGSSDSGGSGSSGSGTSTGTSGSSGSAGATGGTAPSPTPGSTFIQRVIQRFRPSTPAPTEIDEDEQRTEIRLSETERIRTRTKDGRTRIDITAGGIKTRFEIRDDRVIIKAKQEDGSELELVDDTIFKIEERLATNQIKVATDEANRVVIQRGNTGAISQFPLSIDLATNTLIVTTPTGAKNVTVLPDQVVQNLIVTNVVNRLGGSTVVNAVRTGEVSTLSQVVTLGEKNGVLIYEINGLSDQKLLGFIPVTILKTVEVSAQTGEILSTQTSLINRLIDLVSF